MIYNQSQCILVNDTFTYESTGIPSCRRQMHFSLYCMAIDLFQEGCTQRVRNSILIKSERGS